MQTSKPYQMTRHDLRLSWWSFSGGPPPWYWSIHVRKTCLCAFWSSLYGIQCFTLHPGCLNTKVNKNLHACKIISFKPSSRYNSKANTFYFHEFSASNKWIHRNTHSKSFLTRKLINTLQLFIYKITFEVIMHFCMRADWITIYHHKLRRQ